MDALEKKFLCPPEAEEGAIEHDDSGDSDGGNNEGHVPVGEVSPSNLHGIIGDV